MLRHAEKDVAFPLVRPAASRIAWFTPKLSLVSCLEPAFTKIATDDIAEPVSRLWTPTPLGNWVDPVDWNWKEWDQSMIISIESKSKIKVLGFYLGFSGTAGGCNCSYLTSISFSNVKSFEERSGCHSRGHDVRIRGYLRIKMARNVIVPTRAAAK